MSVDNASKVCDEEEDGCIHYNIRWGKRQIDIAVTPIDCQTFSILDLKSKIEEATTVPVSRQKLLGLTYNSAPASDSHLLSEVVFARPLSCILVGTALENRLVDPKEVKDLPEVYNDLDYEPSSVDDVVVKDPLHQKRLEMAIRTITISFISDPRPAKKLLVLDLDYTLFDCKAMNNIEEGRRPFLEEFLRCTHDFFDIVVWSQTSWRWVELKCTELGLLTSRFYKILFVLDRTSMFTICSTHEKSGKPLLHEVKALQLIWSKFPDRWGPHNTLHVDDMACNFAMNRNNGIKVTPYKKKKRGSDIELKLLSIYLAKMAALGDVSTVDHKKWKEEATNSLTNQRN